MCLNIISKENDFCGYILKKDMFYDDISLGIFVGNSSLSDQTCRPSSDKYLSSG